VLVLLIVKLLVDFAVTGNICSVPLLVLVIKTPKQLLEKALGKSNVSSPSAVLSELPNFIISPPGRVTVPDVDIVVPVGVVTGKLATSVST